ncbi:hypothetical protein BUALT_Bualt09G0131000 [Buddleja alternifolia]|uniref:Uncharacterized protein n=1 Tax=Buddleja alternifolia TaxID=168488 RepID=A0AAV6XD62_9LAMI|nr:hypothetical protein BUALT_Bualt09G0131000 [Buddleja alternifolia]
MPCLDISTNVNLDGFDTDSLFSDLTKAFVMILVKGSVALSFGGNREPAALAEIVAMSVINTEMKRKLIATIGSILQNKLCIPRTRFVLKVFDATVAGKNSKL